MSEGSESAPPIFTSFDSFNWKNPDYAGVIIQRSKNLHELRKDPGLLASVRDYYRDDHFVEFIRDWGMMRDPRLAALGRKTVFPFIPFPRQIELLKWFDKMMKERLRGNVDKTRDCGASWCAMAYACYRFLFFDNNDIGFGSSKEANIDEKGNPKALFPKGRAFISALPREFRPRDWNERRDAPYLKLINPENGSTIVGEGGDNIGRGGRTLIYFVDEHAHVERPILAEGALSENTNTQINISTHFGTGTLFFKQCQTLPPSRIFEFDWKEDPRKDQEWYDKKKNDPSTDPIIFAQEIDRDPSASVSDGFIDIKLIDEAMRTPIASTIAHGQFIVSIDVAGMGNDKSIINTRRGDINFPQKKFKKKEGDQLAVEVERHCRKLIAGGQAPLGAIVYELEGPGYGLHSVLKHGPFRKALRPIHPGRKLNSLEFFNERARFWALALEWLEEGGKSIVFDKAFRLQASSLRYEYKINGKNSARKLLLEDKKSYKSRLAADPKNKAAGPSPDESDAWAMGFAPVKLANVTKPAQDEALAGVFPSDSPQWSPIDAVVGY